LIAPALNSLRAGGWLSANALIMAETSKDESFAHDGFTLLDSRDYGETSIAFLTPNPT
jgi:16S rRNA (guanine966-N2)-methyltransferase